MSGPPPARDATDYAKYCMLLLLLLLVLVLVLQLLLRLLLPPLLPHPLYPLLLLLLPLYHYYYDFVGGAGMVDVSGDDGRPSLVMK